MAVIKSKCKGLLGAIAKLGPSDKRDSYAGVKGVYDKLITHLLLLLHL